MKTTFLILTLLTVFVTAAPAQERNEVIIPDLDIEAMAMELYDNELVENGNIITTSEPSLIFNLEGGFGKPIAFIYSEYRDALIDENDNIWEPRESLQIVSSNPLKSCLKDQIGTTFSPRYSSSQLNSADLVLSSCD